ncbi:tetratricopeptide repeat protein [Rhodothalassium salexigens]|uniref:tetratricopeptide repeat protein n=1 Tax=Rhodothalassium salexigens TaxID=1086 RepID=UPI0019128500|nr:tetratricopeptide repeat protein [Rhodothalassium salexigens]
MARLPTPDADAQSLLAEAREAEVQGRTSDAIRRLRKLVEARPQHAEAHYRLGRLLTRKNRWADALLPLRKAVGAAPRTGRYWLALADAYRMLGQDKPLSKLAETAATAGLDADTVRALAQRAEAARTAGDPKPVVDELGEKFQGQDWVGLRQLAEKAVGDFPHLARPWYYLGLACLAQKQLDRAETAFVHALDTAPEGIEGLKVSLAIVYRNQGRIGEAMATLAEVLQSGRAQPPVVCDAATMLGNIHVAAGRLYEAAQAFRRAATANPHSAHHWRKLGQVLLAQGHGTDAVQALRLAAARAPEVPGIWLELGNGLFEAGLLDQATDAYATAARLAPDDDAIRDRLELAAALTGRTI